MDISTKKPINVPIEQVFPYPLNTKVHSSTQVRKIANSIASYGWDQPIVVDAEMVIIKGHGRWLAAKELGLEEVPVVIQDELTPEQVRAARISDNKVAESAWDTDSLWEEMSTLADAGIDARDLGFEIGDLRRMFPDHYQKGTKDEGRVKHDQTDADGNVDPTVPQVESMVAPFRGEDAWMRRLSMLDYLHLHDKVVVGFSGGKDSLAALLWCLENIERDKLVPFFVNLGWGVDWPHGIAYVQLVEEIYDTKINILGPTDPKYPGGFHDLLLQYGYMQPVSCWLRNRMKIAFVHKFLEQQGLLPKQGANICQVIAVRWAESKNREKMYPDRGIIQDIKAHFASPIIQWLESDVVHFFADRGIKLHTAYQHSARMGCLACTHESREGAINTRKKLPELWAQILEWHGRGARKNGRLELHHFSKMLSSINDLTPQQLERAYDSPYSAIAMSTPEYEDYMEEKMGRPLSRRPYVSIPYDHSTHNFRNDLDMTDIIDRPVQDTTVCGLTGCTD